MGKFHQFLAVICRRQDNGGVLSFHVFICLCFSDNQVVLDIWEREPGIRQYKPPIELIWDTGLGTSVHHLKQAISRKLHIPTDNIAMAKHMFQRFEWSIIEEKQKVCTSIIT